jgi:hypothetical protein
VYGAILLISLAGCDTSILVSQPAECRRVMVIDLHEMVGRGDLEPKTSSYVRRPPFVERRVSCIC